MQVQGTPAPPPPPPKKKKKKIHMLKLYKKRAFELVAMSQDGGCAVVATCSDSLGFFFGGGGRGGIGFRV